MNVNRSALESVLADDDAFQLALAAAVRRSYELFGDDLPAHLELTNADYAVLIDVVADQLRGLYRGDTTMIRIEMRDRALVVRMAAE